MTIQVIYTLYITMTTGFTSYQYVCPFFVKHTSVFAYCVFFCKLCASWSSNLRCRCLLEAPECTSELLWSVSLFSRYRKAVHGPEVSQQPTGQEESELPSDKEIEGSLTLTSYQNQQGGLSPRSASGKKCTVEEIQAFFKMFSSLKSLQYVSVVKAGYWLERSAERVL